MKTEFQLLMLSIPLPVDFIIHLKCVCPLLAIPWTAAPQAPLSMEFSSQEYWSGWPFPTSSKGKKSKQNKTKQD